MITSVIVGRRLSFLLADGVAGVAPFDIGEVGGDLLPVQPPFLPGPDWPPQGGLVLVGVERGWGDGGMMGAGLSMGRRRAAALGGRVSGRFSGADF
ncbi:hypothetical protein Ssi03_69950 [Sphaerisporangium siamense]|nr:hypothetical protein Ssi03_69950 [Sphaerisporangium siamense]